MEGVVLTGGASRRMGRDKATHEVDGESLALRVARSLRAAGLEVAVLGRESVEGFTFVRDREEFSGPLAALRVFAPRSPWVFVASCDMPLFRADVPRILAHFREDGFQAVVPTIGGRLQPLCAWYAADAFELLWGHPEWSRMFDWLDALRVREVGAEELEAEGGNPNWMRGANSPQELENLLDSDPD